MKKNLSILLLLFTFNFSFGQEINNSLKKSKFALQFQISNGYDFLSFNGFIGNTFSGKYHLLDNSAIRLGISLNKRNDISNKLNNTNSLKNEILNLALNLQFLHYLKTVEDISLYIGGGPYYEREKYTLSYRIADNYSLGLSMISGVEWFLKKNISLTAEYGLLIYYKNTNEIENENIH